MTQDHKAITFVMTAHGVPQPVIDYVLGHGVKGSVYTALCRRLHGAAAGRHRRHGGGVGQFEGDR